jgi:flagellar FliJ protein
MSDAQLHMVAQWERDKEEQCARTFQLAQQELNQNQQKLKGLEQYRQDYLQLAQNKASEGVNALHFNQHHAFIAKLDKACEQQMVMLNNLSAVAEQRKQFWLIQQRKRKAVEHLIQQKAQQKEARLQRQEQCLLDEHTMQQFLRRRRSA